MTTRIALPTLLIGTLVLACLAFDTAAYADTDSASDASVTFLVKSKLDANTNTRGLPIRVATRNGVVTLRGEVRSAEEKDLAELLARNAVETAAVQNDLVVRTRPIGR
jgi:osmotically-inducible protein OsmY